jgi:PAS domain-containing protein
MATPDRLRGTRADGAGRAALHADARAASSSRPQLAPQLRQPAAGSAERRCAGATAACCGCRWRQAAGRRGRPRGRRDLLLCRRRRALPRPRGLAAAGRAHPRHPRFGAGGHRHRGRRRHRVDEPLGPPHVRRRAGRLRRRADQHRGHARGRPPAAPRRLPPAPGRRPGRDLRMPAEGRDGREFWVVGNAVVTGRGRWRPAGRRRRTRQRQLTFALLDIERRRQAEVSIAQAQASLQRIIETAPLAIALFDARSGAVLQLNQMAGDVLRPPWKPCWAAGPRNAAAPRGGGAALPTCRPPSSRPMCCAASCHRWREWRRARCRGDACGMCASSRCSPARLGRQPG